MTDSIKSQPTHTGQAIYHLKRDGDSFRAFGTLLGSMTDNTGRMFEILQFGTVFEIRRRGSVGKFVEVDIASLLKNATYLLTDRGPEQ